MASPNREHLVRAADLADRGVPFVVATLVKIEGHVPQDVGAKAIVTSDGLAWGTVGGGRLEARALDHARAMLDRAVHEDGAARPVSPELVRYDLARDLEMVCGGAATLFYEIVAAPTWDIVVFGAGHVAQATVGLLSTFACNLTCIDPRAEWLERLPIRPNLRTRLVTEPAEAVSTLPTGAFVLCMTRGHATDLPIVRELVKSGRFPFIGVIGSEPKARTLRGALLGEGLDGAAVAAIRCPLGLRIGSNAPAEIAVSIAAQLLDERDRASTTRSASVSEAQSAEP